MAGKTSAHTAQLNNVDTNKILIDEDVWKAARRFKVFIENSSDVIFILDTNAIFRYSSPSTKKILGYPSEKLVGRSIFDLIHPEDSPTFAKAIETARQSPGANLPEIEVRIKHGTEEWRIVAANINNLIDESTVNGILVNGHDITARKQNEIALRQNRELLNEIISSISDHIYVTELTQEGEHINRYLSRNIEILTGYPIKMFMNNRNFWPSTVIHPDDRAAAAEQAKKLDSGQHSEMEYRLIQADGTIIWVRDSGTVKQAVRSKLIYGVVSNITARKRLEEELRQSHKMEAVGRLAGGIAHDFNNLLTVIIGNTELLLNTLEADHPMHSDIEKVRNAGARAAALTRQLLAFSRRQVLKPELLNLNQIIENMEEMLQRVLGEEIEMIKVPDNGLGLVKADLAQIEQIIMNLIANARDAMPDGGKLTVETANVGLTEDLSSQHNGMEPGAYVTLSISDTGLGIAEKTKKRIFEPFFSTKTRDEAIGLSLATVHSIVEQSGGYIWVHSEPKSGTTFRVYLPRHHDEDTESIQASSAPAPPRQETPTSSQTILLVEDEFIIRELAYRVLSGKGYNILQARHGEEAIKIATRHREPIHLLITDIVMPGGMNGSDLAKRLTIQFPEMQTLYMSGYPVKAVAHYGIINPEIQFLSKPFTPDDLVKKVQTILDNPKHN